MTDPAELFNDALAAQEAGDTARAVELLIRLVAVHPEDREAVGMLVDLFLERGDAAGAEAVLATVSAAAPQEVAYPVHRAALRLEAGDPRGAAALLTAALKLRPGHWEALSLLGDAFSDVAAYAEAARAYRLALDSNPFSPDVWYNLAVALGEAGDGEGAAAAFEGYLRVRPDAPDQGEIAMEIKRLRAGP